MGEKISFLSAVFVVYLFDSFSPVISFYLFLFSSFNIKDSRTTLTFFSKYNHRDISNAARVEEHDTQYQNSHIREKRSITCEGARRAFCVIAKILFSVILILTNEREGMQEIWIYVLDKLLKYPRGMIFSAKTTAKLLSLFLLYHFWHLKSIIKVIFRQRDVEYSNMHRPLWSWYLIINLSLNLFETSLIPYLWDMYLTMLID